MKSSTTKGRKARRPWLKGLALSSAAKTTQVWGELRLGHRWDLNHEVLEAHEEEKRDTSCPSLLRVL